ncbi:hypothetical protein FB451DRAFT_1391957 [Mycena latifolia]|nr:hypothetical protein FB451DRAFT_1391957 [Mycena latifolia]
MTRVVRHVRNHSLFFLAATATQSSTGATVPLAPDSAPSLDYSSVTRCAVVTPSPGSVGVRRTVEQSNSRRAPCVLTRPGEPDARCPTATLATLHLSHTPEVLPIRRGHNAPTSPHWCATRMPETRPPRSGASHVCHTDLDRDRAACALAARASIWSTGRCDNGAARTHSAQRVGISTAVHRLGAPFESCPPRSGA